MPMRRPILAAALASLLVGGAIAVHARRPAVPEAAADDALVPPLVVFHAGLRLLP